MTDTAKVRMYDKEYPFLMPGELTLGELADAEDITGQGYDLETGGFKAFLALAYLSVRRIDPRITVDEMRELVGDQIEFVRPDGDAQVPPESSAVSSSSGGETGESSSPSSGLHRVPTRVSTGDPA